MTAIEHANEDLTDNWIGIISSQRIAPCPELLTHSPPTHSALPQSPLSPLNQFPTVRSKHRFIQATQVDISIRCFLTQAVSSRYAHLTARWVAGGPAGQRRISMHQASDVSASHLSIGAFASRLQAITAAYFCASVLAVRSVHAQRREIDG